MSYARFGQESDVYVFSDGDRLHCVWCRLCRAFESAVYAEYPDMIAHLEEHRAAGHKVPDYALERLRQEGALHPSVTEVSRLERQE